MKFDRNLIVFVGPSAVGKTFGMNNLREYLKDHHIPFNEQSITDSSSIVRQIQKDDAKTGGKNHFHEWCEGQVAGHSHEGDKPDLGFTVTGYAIPRGMYKDFTDELAKSRSHDKLWLVEWSGAVSENKYGDANYSFALMRKEFENGVYNKSWFPHVLAVIHPYVPTFDGRLALNHLRENNVPNDEERIKGTKSWPLPRSAMDLFHYDDFEEGLRPYLEAQGLHGKIHTIDNHGDGELIEGTIGYHKRLNEKFDELFAPIITKEGQFRGKEK